MHPMLISCFVAPDDEQAAQVIDWPSGPVEPAGDAEGQDAFPVVDTKIEPVVTLTKLAEILSGTPYDELAADKRISTLLAQKDEYEVLVLTVSDSVKAALAEVGCPCVIVTHDPIDVAALADDVAVLESGRIVEHGPVAEVIAYPESSFGKLLFDRDQPEQSP